MQLQPLSVFLLHAFFSFSRLSTSSQVTIISLYTLLCALCLATILRKRGSHIFIVNYGCFLPPISWRTPFASFLEHCRLFDNAYEIQSIDFQRKIIERSGISQLSCLPPALHYLPPRTDIASARYETETALFGAIEELFASVDIQPHQIGILVTNCSVFNPTPSIATILINKYKLPVDVKSFSLSGMGCAAGVLALDLAHRLLLIHPGTYALVLSTENVTENLYCGNRRSMLVTNCLFRAGASAVLLSNRWGDRRKSKYQVLHTARSQMGAHDLAYRSIYQEEDDKGIVGVSLSKELMQSAGMALEHNLRLLGPKVLPTWDIILYITSMVGRKLRPGPGKGEKPYVPKFKRIFDHICVHAGGKAVVRAVEKNLDIPREMTEASYMTLYRFGNLSSASVWYELGYEEAKGWIKRGDKVWQIGLGSGFKCCSAVLKALKGMDRSCSPACWADIVATLPVPLPLDQPDAHAH
ncbi:hypothetical protein GOP47_0024266 [Adiantum capillus-veneris]|uniref:3-ketoacyl-CoA synthase n=1 Tax=Adiantum capillus-veneris TaxID=13818 RepID=A0A9D4U545_ADICA|nr:hypothetical protein GOP47_0024266 [Adiantum capillus-veneris]